jgi:hypothetical protein
VPSDVSGSDDEHSLVTEALPLAGQPYFTSLLASVTRDVTQLCQHQSNGQLGCGESVHASAIAKSHAGRDHVQPRVDTSREHLDYPQSGHQRELVDCQRTAGITPDKKLRRGDARRRSDRAVPK